MSLFAGGLHATVKGKMLQAAACAAAGCGPVSPGTATPVHAAGFSIASYSQVCASTDRGQHVSKHAQSNAQNAAGGLSPGAHV